MQLRLVSAFSASLAPANRPLIDFVHGQWAEVPDGDLYFYLSDFQHVVFETPGYPGNRWFYNPEDKPCDVRCHLFSGMNSVTMAPHESRAFQQTEARFAGRCAALRQMPLALSCAEESVHTAGIMRLGGLGDVLFALPALRTLHDLGTGTDLWLLTKPSYRRLVECTGAVDHVGSFYAAYGTDWTPLDAVDEWSSLYEASPRRTETHRVGIACERLGLPSEAWDFSLPAMPGYGDAFLSDFGPKAVACYSTGSIPQRNVPRTDWVRMVLALADAGYTPVVCDLRDPGIDDPRVVVRTLSWNDDLESLAGTMRSCAACICVDTGPLYMSIAMGVPTVALFGPIEPRLRIPAEWEHVRVVTGNASSGCPPCDDQATHGCSATGEDGVRCLGGIDSAELVNAVEQLVGV